MKTEIAQAVQALAAFTFEVLQAEPLPQAAELLAQMREQHPDLVAAADSELLFVLGQCLDAVAKDQRFGQQMRERAAILQTHCEAAADVRRFIEAVTAPPRDLLGELEGTIPRGSLTDAERDETIRLMQERDDEINAIRQRNVQALADLTERVRTMERNLAALRARLSR
jgi:hypothetical protein